MINTNVTAVALLTRQFAPGMVQRNKGHIINISSIAAHYHYKGGECLLLFASFCGWFYCSQPCEVCGQNMAAMPSALLEICQQMEFLEHARSTGL